MIKNLKKLLLLLLIVPIAFSLVSCKKKNNNEPENPEPDKVTYEISYVLFGGVNNAENPYSYISGNDEITLLEPSRENYNFEGWYSDENFDNQVFVIEADSTENKTFYAKWEAKSFNITYYLNGGTNNTENPNTYTVESEVVFSNPSFEPYRFGGWYLDSNFISPITKIDKGTYGNKSLYAKWNDAYFDIFYELNGGINNVFNPTSYKYSNNVVDILKPTKIGYNFKGWFTESTFENEVFQIEPRATGTKTFYAKWEAIEYQIVYELNGGDNNKYNLDTYTVEVDEVELREPSKFGYDFEGWYTEETFENKITIIETKTQNKVYLYAKWAPKTIKITLNYDGATENNNVEYIEVTYNTQIGELPTPLKTDYVFEGWWRNNILYTEETVIKFNEDITLTAIWIPYAETILYTIEFDSDGGTSVESIIDISFASKINKPTDPQKLGYNFEGWFLNNEEWNFEENRVTSNETLVAHWDLINYEINYELDEGDNNKDNPITFTIEDEDITLLEPTKDGYDFIGWYLDENLSQKIEKIEHGSTGNKTLYASWKKSMFTKPTADITVRFNLPEQFAGIYQDYVTTISVREIFLLVNFANTNFEKYFLGYSYINYDDELVVLDGNIYKPDSSLDITIDASWDTDALLKYYYSDGLTFTISNDTAYVSNYTGSSDTIFIPEYYNINGKDYLIDSIGDSAFLSNIFISKVKFLPRENTLEIKNSAFKNSSLEEFDFTYVTKIYNSAFFGTSIKSVKSSANLSSTEASIFENCINLTEVDFSEASEYYYYIYSRSFYGCSKLTTVKLSKTIISIGNYAFANCSSLTNINFISELENNVSIGNYAFMNCTSLNNILIPSNVNNLGENVFDGCDNLKIIEITNLFKIFNSSTFANVYRLNNIEEITVSGNAITKIPNGYFANLSKLEKFVMSDYVTIIEEDAFKNCSLLSDITLSKNLELAQFTLSAFTGTYWISQMTDLIVIESTLVYIPANENMTEVIIESGVTAISQNASKDNEFLKYLYIPNTVEIISISAFENCTSLDEVVFEENSSLKEISNRAFSNCVSLNKFDLKDCLKLETIGDYAFYRLGYSKNVYVGEEDGFTLPSSLLSIGDGLFNQAKILKYNSNSNYFATDENGILYGLDEEGNKVSVIVAPNSLNIVFYILPTTVKRIYSYAFYYTEAPSYIYIKDGVQFGLNSYKYSTILASNTANIQFEYSTKVYYIFTELTDNFEYELINGVYNITLSEDVSEGYYYIVIDNKAMLIAANIVNETIVVTTIVDITEFFNNL